MQAINTQHCLHAEDFSSYLQGSRKPYDKTRIEKHLNMCTQCFERFLLAFNRHLDHPVVARGAGASRISGRRRVSL